MKKQFLILFAFISVLALSQVPQRFNKVIVTGDIASPKFIKTGSTSDSVLLGNGGVKSVVSFKTDTTSLSARINLKEPLLPSTPPNPESRFLNGNKQWAEIVLGSGGYASNVYFTNLTSTIVGTYKQTSGIHELTETIASGTCNNNEVLIHTYLFEQPVGITTVDAGVWRFTMNCAITSNVGDSKFKIVQFRRSSTGVETDMFTIYSNTIENTDYQNFIIETVQPSFLVDSLDHFGCRVYATTTTTVNKTISYKVGDGNASYLNTPLALGHNQLRRLNIDPNNQHVTASNISKWNTTSANNTVDETLTSIKTKLGAASSVSDGYLRYQDFALLHTPTTVTASNGLSISGQNISLQNANTAQSGALTFNDWNTFNSKEPAITKNSGFNLPLGTTTGTVLEGRTFGTAANSAVGDFQPIENQRLSTTNSPSFASSTLGYLEIQNSGIYPGVGLTQSSNYLVAKMGSNGFILRDPTNNIDAIRSNIYGDVSFSATSKATSFIGVDELTGSALNNYFELHRDGALGGCRIQANRNASLGGVGFKFAVTTSNADEISGTYTTAMEIDRTTAATFYSTVNSTGFLLNGNNLTSSLSTNYIPKWNGSSFVNATAGADYQLPITLTTNGTSGAATFNGNTLNIPNYSGGNAGIDQTQTVINGSTSGTLVCSMPFQTASYKKVILKGAPFGGDATYTFPTSFTAFGQPFYSITGAITIVSLTSTSITINASTTSAGWVILEGY